MVLFTGNILDKFPKSYCGFSQSFRWLFMSPFYTTSEYCVNLFILPIIYLGLANANQIPWSNVKAMMTTEYCPTTEIQRMEQELMRTLTLKGDDIEAYTNRFHELVLMCPELVSTENKKIEKYIRGFPEGIKKCYYLQSPATFA
ncbi:putative reverse transcriptase domain-containing protein [Tanacetum coccineum]|uniref:Reverse transcriptase domain-containing protein n=1 Tax=Tanacetum coccineum TaxID=301880 RepID=A0ABQ5BIK0_9ASTR